MTKELYFTLIYKEMFSAELMDVLEDTLHHIGNSVSPKLCSVSLAETGKTQLRAMHRFQRPGCPYEFLFWVPGTDDKYNHKRIEITATSQVTPIKEL